MLFWIAVVAGVWLFSSVVVSLGLARAICLSKQDRRPVAPAPVLISQRSPRSNATPRRLPVLTH